MIVRGVRYRFPIKWIFREEGIGWLASSKVVTALPGLSLGQFYEYRFINAFHSSMLPF